MHNRHSSAQQRRSARAGRSRTIVRRSGDAESWRLSRTSLGSQNRRTGTLEFPRVIFLRIDPFWAPESIDSGKSVDPESTLLILLLTIEYPVIA